MAFRHRKHQGKQQYTILFLLFLPCQSVSWFVNYSYLLHNVLEVLHQNSSTPSQVYKAFAKQIFSNWSTGRHMGCLFDSSHHDAGITPLNQVPGLNLPFSRTQECTECRLATPVPFIFFPVYFWNTILNLFLVRTAPYCSKSLPIHYFT